MNIKLNESNEIRLRYAVADSKSPDAWDDSFWTKGGTLADIYGLEQNIDIFDDSKSAENLAHEVLKDIQDFEVFVVSIDEGGNTDFIKRIGKSKDSQDNLKESNSGILYAIAYCEDPDIYSNDFWCWDTESDIGYELMEFGSLIQDADVFDSLEAAEDRADDVLSSIFEDEVFIVGLDPYTPHNLTGFVKKVTRDSIKESKSIDETNEKALSYEELIELARENYTKGGDSVYECWDEREFNDYVKEFGPITKEKAYKLFGMYDQIDRGRDGYVAESIAIKESNTSPEDKFLFYFPYMGGPKTLNKERTIRQLEFELDNIKNSSGSGIAGRGFGVYCLESVDTDTGTVWTGRYSSKEFLNCLHESKSKSINEGWSGDTYKGYSILLNDDSINWDAEQVRLVWRILDKDGNKVGSVAGQANARKYIDDIIDEPAIKDCLKNNITGRFTAGGQESAVFAKRLENASGYDWRKITEVALKLGYSVYKTPSGYEMDEDYIICHPKGDPEDLLYDFEDSAKDEVLKSTIEPSVQVQSINESKSIKESATGDYIEVAYICDGFTNFRIFGGGFKTSDALVSVEDEKGKRLRLTMGDVCEFYTWYDAKGNVIHEPGYIDDANLNENYVPEYGDEFPNMNAAMYVARSLVYHFVSDPDDAEKLYAKAESDGWESSELVALCDLIGDALEASNYHSEARDYFYDKFPYWWAFDVSAEDEAKMDELIESCDDDNQRMQLLIIAVNSLVLELD